MMKNQVRTLQLFIAYLFVHTVNTFDLKCHRELSIDISDGVQVENFIIKNGVVYNESNYYFSDNKTYGCVCNLKRCIRKCCPLDSKVSNKTCQPSEYDFYELLQENSGQVLEEKTYYPITGFIQCRPRYKMPANGKLKITSGGYLSYLETLDQMHYCIDYFEEFSHFSSLICLNITEVSKEGTTGMIISMPFLLATFLVYAFLPDRNLPAKALMCYVLSLLFAYILLVTIQLDESHGNITCQGLAFFCYFFFMASFFWMNASCLDIFFTFSGIRGLLGDRKRENRRFIYYSAYAWGVPVLMVAFASLFGQNQSNESVFYTGLGDGQCWFRSGWTTGIYFYFPIATLLIINIVLFGITTYKIKKVQHDTKMLKNVDSRKHKYDNNDKQRFNLYVKLLFAMGINWSMEVISWVIMWKWATVPDSVWILTDFCNAVYGVFIFFIFVFKRNIWMLLKKRYLQVTGRPQQAHTLTSTHRTTFTASLRSLSKSLERKITPSCLRYNEANINNGLDNKENQRELMK